MERELLAVRQWFLIMIMTTLQVECGAARALPSGSEWALRVGKRFLVIERRGQRAGAGVLGGGLARGHGVGSANRPHPVSRI